MFWNNTILSLLIEFCTNKEILYLLISPAARFFNNQWTDSILPRRLLTAFLGWPPAPRKALPVRQGGSVCLEPRQESLWPCHSADCRKESHLLEPSCSPKFFPHNIPLCPPCPPSNQTLQGSLTHTVFVPPIFLSAL